MSFNGITEEDFQDAFGRADDFTRDFSIAESFGSSVKSSLSGGPTAYTAAFALDKFRDSDILTGAEANERYGLTDSPIAYKDDEQVKDFSARMAADNYYESQRHERLMQDISNDDSAKGWMAWATSGAGSLTGGALDPTGVGLGIGGAMAIRKLGQMSGAAFLTNIANNSLGQTIAREGLENLAGEVITNISTIYMGEDVLRQTPSVQDRLMNILGGAAMGTAIGTLSSRLDYNSQTAEINGNRVSANKISNDLGSRAEKVVGDAQAKVILDEAKGKKINPEHVFKREELEVYTPRNGQQPHNFVELDETTIQQESFFIGQDAEAKSLDVISDRGDGVMVVTSNRNLAENRVKGKVFEVSVDKANILLEKDFPTIKDNFVAAFKKSLDPRFHKAVDAAYAESFNVTQFVENVMNSVDDARGLPNLDNNVTKTLKDMGYDGYHFVHTSKHLDNNISQNNIAIFDPQSVGKAVDAPKKAKMVSAGSYEVEIGDGNKWFIDRVTQGDRKGEWSVSYGKDPFGAEWSNDYPSLKAAKEAVTKDTSADAKFKMGEGVETVPFDPKHPESADLVNRIKQHGMAEAERLNSHTSDYDYIPEAVEDLNRPIEASPEGFDPAQDLADELGVRSLREAYEARGMKDAKLEADIDAVDSPNKFRESANNIVNCVVNFAKSFIG